MRKDIEFESGALEHITNNREILEDILEEGIKKLDGRRDIPITRRVLDDIDDNLCNCTSSCLGQFSNCCAWCWGALRSVGKSFYNCCCRRCCNRQYQLLSAQQQ